MNILCRIATVLEHCLEIKCSTFICFAIGCRRWSAPELVDKLTSDERADVWSVGRIGLSMILAGIPETEISQDKLEKIRYSSEVLDSLLNLASEVGLFQSCLH